MTLEDFKRYINVINACDPDLTDFYTVSGNGTQFKIVGKNGWTKGNDYCFVLLNDALYFTDFYEEDHDNPTELDMTVKKEEIIQFSIRNGITYIPISAVSSLTVNGISISKPSVSDIIAKNADDNTSIATNGSFVCDTKLKTGDIVGIYIGNVPDGSSDELISSDPTCSYIEITSLSNKKYSYRGADASDVIFTPDVFPVPLSADTDGNDNDNKIRALEKWFVYTDGSMEKYGIDIDTTVDIGDFIAFYSGNSLSKAVIKEYAKITSVKTETTKDGIYFIIGYTTVSKAQMLASTDTVYSRELTKEEYNKIVEEKNDDVLNAILQSATETDFIKESAENLAAALIETDEYRNKVKSLSLDPDTLPVTLTAGFSDYQPKRFEQLAGGKQRVVEIAIKKIKPYLSTDLVYYKNLEGIRLTLEVEIEITVHAEKADIKFIVTGEFQQELRLKINIDANAVWDTTYIIPYISDYKVSTKTDIYEYTSMGLKVNVTVEEAANGIASSPLLRKAKKMYKKAQDVTELIGNIKDSSAKILGSEDDELIATQLAEVYAEMVTGADDPDWADLLTVNIFDQHICILKIIDIEIAGDFVISVKMNLTAGTVFSFASAKRYIFNLYLKEKTVTNKSIDLAPEEFEFTFYAVGTAGIRAGIQLGFHFGLVSTEFDSVGLRVRVGAFIQAYGYYYYNYKRTVYNGKTTTTGNSAGALYFELGIFLRIDFVAQIGAGLIGTNIEILDMQWPLLKKGEIECVQNFVDPGYDEIILKHAYTQAYLPERTVTVEYLDLLKGAKKVADEDSDDIELFTKNIKITDLDIVITNDKFIYDAVHNRIDVNPDEKDRYLDGELIITYKAELAFSKNPIQLRIALHWDNLADGYFIVFETLGGSYITPRTLRYGKEIIVPADPTRAGYRFTGWYSDPDCTIPYTIPKTMPMESLVLYAGWEEDTANYTVEHYIENLNGIYECAETEVFTAKTGSIVSPLRKEYEGFTPSDQQEISVEADSSSIVKYFYSRNTYNSIFKINSSDSNPIIRELKFGSSLLIPAFSLKGYTFEGWDIELPETVPSSDKTYTAKWSPSENTEYRICYYLQNSDGIGYTLNETEILKGKTNSTISVNAKTINNYTPLTKSVSGVIASDGSTKLDIYYNRNIYTITFETSQAGIGTGTPCPSAEYRFGAKVFTPYSSLNDYALVGWYTDKALTIPFDGIMPAQSITLYAKWEQGTAYRVEHYLMKTDGTYTAIADYTDTLYLQVGQSNIVTPSVMKINGFNSPESQSLTVNADGKSVLKYYYVRQQYTLTVIVDGKSEAKVLYYEQPIVLTEPTKIGYSFVDYSPALPATMPDHNLQITANFKAEKYTVTYHLGHNQPDTVKTVEYGSSIPEYIPTLKGYTFNSWNTSLPTTMPAENIEFTAKWDVVTYSVKIEINNSTASFKNVTPKTSYTIEDEQFTIPNPSSDYYTFTGWKDEKSGTVYTGYTVFAGSTGNISLVGTWSAKKYTVKLVPGKDATKSGTTSVNVGYNEKLPNISTLPERNGYTFGGYYSGENGTGTQYYKADGTPTSTSSWTSTNVLTLYAKWTVKSFDVIFDEAGVQKITLTFEKYSFTMPSPSKTGYYFIGWTTIKGDRTAQFTAGQSITQLINNGYKDSITLYPIWLKRVYSVSNILINGSKYYNQYSGSKTYDTRIDADGNVQEWPHGTLLKGLYVNDDTTYTTSAIIYLSPNEAVEKYGLAEANNVYKDNNLISNEPRIGKTLSYSYSVYRIGAPSYEITELAKKANSLSITLNFEFYGMDDSNISYKIIAGGVTNTGGTKVSKSGTVTDNITLLNIPTDMSSIEILFDANGDSNDCYMVTKISVELDYRFK